MIGRIKKCFLQNRVVYSQHARDEMRSEELGPISEQEVFDAVQTGEVIESYEHKGIQFCAKATETSEVSKTSEVWSCTPGMGDS